MNSLSTFFRTLVKSTISPAYYNDVVKAPFSFSLKYFVALNLLAAFISGLLLVIPLSLLDLATNVRDVSSNYPAELAITADDRGLTINQPLPYSVPFPEQLEGSEETELPSNFITFSSDEVTPGISDVRALDSLAVVTESIVYAYTDNDTQKIEAYPMPEFSEAFTIDRALVDTTVARIAENPLFRYELYIPLLILLSVLVFFPIYTIFRLITIALYSGIVWLIARALMNEKQLSFEKSFQVGLHAITPMLIVGYALGFFSFLFISGLPYFIVFISWNVFLVSQLRARTSVAISTVATSTKAPRSKAKKVAKPRSAQKK